MPQQVGKRLRSRSRWLLMPAPFCVLHQRQEPPSTPTAKLVLDVVDDEDLWRPSCVYVCLCGAQFGWWWWWWKLWGVHSLPLLLLALVN